KKGMTVIRGVRTVWWLLLGTGALGMLLAGCGTRPIRPDDMSARSHRLEAARERNAADVQVREYDPKAVAERPAPHGPPQLVEGAPPESYATYNPTQFHLREAARHAAHAREHEQAAAE